ncbi:hypothetical protein ASPSYDRAFT_140754 [Aspergillus sydowii CBS 593.65]|uniref:Uncharacterized protein n=1 Tax=Aspergillus sydowii CBS 593.65 TaxID=1036612 RepID=A0A1L9TXQ0_9EURO|nr:uncharacterized protein ASPSYDRAFT_140754 [Aspergillus sydowii CBS 593.65]OJJ64207.1 hypothetical protein ASPSYDRAFT_140754 [Aspergillus sydowii CBS 593.65]
MKFSLATIAAFASAVAAATLPSSFTLVADGGSTVVTDGQYLYVGGDVTNKTEIAIFNATPDTGAVSFTRKGAVPTAFQNLYVVEKTVLPVEFTVPHSGNTPEGASTLDFGRNDDGYFTHAGKDYFAIEGYGDAKVKTVYWYGAHSSTYKAVNLWVKEFN